MQAAKQVNAKIIYISTDYVFDGENPDPYQVNEPANPQSIYGRTKYEGEKLVREYPKHFIVRIAWVLVLMGAISSKLC